MLGTKLSRRQYVRDPMRSIQDRGLFSCEASRCGKLKAFIGVTSRMHYCINPAARWVRSRRHIVLYPLGGSRRCCRLGNIARAVWLQLADGQSLQEVIRQMSSNYAISEDAAKKTLYDVLTNLERLGYVSVDMPLTGVSATRDSGSGRPGLTS